MTPPVLSPDELRRFAASTDNVHLAWLLREAANRIEWLEHALRRRNDAE